MVNALMTLVLEATDHAVRIEAIVERKAADLVAAGEREARAVAAAVTPELQGAIEALTERLKRLREQHEAGESQTSPQTAPQGTPQDTPAKDPEPPVV